MKQKRSGPIEEIKKKKRRDHLIMYSIVGVLCVFFLALTFITGGFKDFGKRNNEADPSPTPDPRPEVVGRLTDLVGGTVTESAEGFILTYQSAADGSSPVVKVYLSSGIPAMSVTRKIGEPEPAPTSLFAEDDVGEDPDVFSELCKSIADETAGCIGCLFESVSSPDAAELSDAIFGVLQGASSKATVIFGIYIATVSYDGANGILAVKCEPA